MLVYPQGRTGVESMVMPSLLPLVLFTQSTTQSIDTYCQTGLHDATFTAKVVSGDQDALQKIGRDFGTSYKFSSARVFLEEPFKLRVESNYEGSKVVMVENDLKVVYSLPGVGKKGRDLTHAPGARQTMLDFGILTPSLFATIFDAAFVSESSTDGTVTFDLTFKASPDYKDTTRYRVVIDSAKHYVMRRDWFGQDGGLRAIFRYDVPVQVGGCWVPTDMKVSNAEGKLAGVTRAEGLKINAGIDEKLFGV
jgi:hypothetical protein